MKETERTALTLLSASKTYYDAWRVLSLVQELVPGYNGFAHADLFGTAELAVRTRSRADLMTVIATAIAILEEEG